MDDITKELILIQDVIKRMADNSFKIKGWTVTLVSAILFLNQGYLHQYLITLVPIICFWYLDAYYLHQERLYRRLYNWVIKNRNESSEFLYSLNAYRFSSEEQSVMKIMTSKTLLTFYGTVSVVTILLLALSFIEA